MRMGDELTARQRSVLQFVIDYHRRHRVAPSVREIGRGVGLRSPAGVHRILDILKARGYLAAANPAYADMVFRNRERRRVTIVGRLVGVVRGWR